MKFNHRFALKSKTDITREYKCDNINARIDFISKSAIRVAIYNDGSSLLATYNVCPDNKLSAKGRERLSLEGFNTCSPALFEAEGKDAFKLDCGVEISLDLNNFLLAYSNNGKVLFKDRAPLAYNLENEFGRDYIHYISREENELVLGLGDKGGTLNKACKAFRIETTDSMGYNAEITDPLYKHIPFYICENSAGAYGIFYDTSATSYMDLGKEINNYYEPYKYFKTEDNCIIYYVFFGTKLEILQQYASLCGRQAFPPKWSFDYCASTMAYTDAPNSQEEFDGFLAKIKDTKLSCRGFYLSSGYTSIGEGRYVFNWNYDKFPNPAKFIKDFADGGINIIPNIKPAFLTSHPMYDELQDKGLFIKNPDGTPLVTQFWDGLGSYLDFTNYEAFDFWKKQVTEKLLDYGIIATWNDNNEFDIKDCEALTNGGINADLLRPTLTYLMVLSSYQAQIAKSPNLRPFLSTRSGGIGVRRLAQTWSGDNRTAFEDLRYCHNIGLTMSLSGLYFYGHDLGGFTGSMPSRELLLRWLQHGIFEPRFTIHSWNSDGSATMPWSYPDILPSVQALFRQRRRLLPYLYNCAYNAVHREVPINAPLLLYFDDCNFSESNSFMLGRDILATCIFDEGAEAVSVYLPKGYDWYLGSEKFSGGQTVEMNIKPTDEMPFFIRGGSVIPFDEGECTYGAEEDIHLNIYPIERGEFEAEYFCDDGESFDYLDGNCVKLKIRVDCRNDEIIVSYTNEGQMPYEPKFRLCEADGRKLTIK